MTQAFVVILWVDGSWRIVSTAASLYDDWREAMHDAAVLSVQNNAPYSVAMLTLPPEPDGRRR